MVVIPLQDLNISSGQLMLLQAMQLGKPIIVTNNCAIYDYIEDGKTGLILANEKKLWIEAIKKIYNDSDFYDMLSKMKYILLSMIFRSKVWEKKLVQ